MSSVILVFSYHFACSVHESEVTLFHLLQHPEESKLGVGAERMKRK